MATKTIAKKIDWSTWVSILSTFIALLTYMSANVQFKRNYELALSSNRAQDIQDSINQVKANERFRLQLQQEQEQFLKNRDLTDEQVKLVSRQVDYYGKQLDIQNLQLGLQKDEVNNKKRSRVKDIVKRLTEIQTLLINNQLNAGLMQQATIAEATNLVKEAAEISEANYKDLSAAEYMFIAHWCNQVNYTERLKDIIERGIRVSTDANTLYGLKNALATYHYYITKDYTKGKKEIIDIIQFTKEQKVFEDMKTVNIANEYLYWCGLEFAVKNYSCADSVLRIAESMVLGENAWRYQTYPATISIKNTRVMLDTLLKKNYITN